MAYVDRWGLFGVPATLARRRPIRGWVLHNTVTRTLATPQVGRSWAWQLDRDGQLYRDVPEIDWCAHHVRATDRWRPPWVTAAPPKLGISDANYCTIGLELVSYAGAPDYPPDYEPYTAAQYAALRWFAEDAALRHGPLPWVGHGEVQADRSDPVTFDWTRAGFGPLDRQVGGRLWRGTGGVKDVAILTDDETWAVQQHVWDAGAIGLSEAQRDFAIPTSWRAEWRAGRWRGEPRGDEIDLGNGRVAQTFEHGGAAYVPGQPVSWSG